MTAVNHGPKAETTTVPRNTAKSSVVGPHCSSPCRLSTDVTSSSIYATYRQNQISGRRGVIRFVEAKGKGVLSGLMTQRLSTDEVIPPCLYRGPLGRELRSHVKPTVILAKGLRCWHTFSVQGSLNPFPLHHLPQDWCYYLPPEPNGPGRLKDIPPMPHHYRT